MYEKLKKIREGKRITQEEMAIKLGYAHKAGYSKLENGQRKITIDKAKQIADILGCTIEELFFAN